MKKIGYLIFGLVTVNISLFAQTNYFPTSGSVGIGTTTPSTYFHGGTNNAVEIYNPSTTLNSQSHILLSTGSVLDNSSAGTISWISKNSTGAKGMAYISSSFEGNGASNAMGRLIFATSNGMIAPMPRMWINKDGTVGIGTSETAGYLLAVKGSIRSQEIKVETQNWPDYVFTADYQLPSLADTEQFIKENGHLPEVPKADDVEVNGVSLGEMNKILLKKVEELTLHLIDLSKITNKQQLLIEKLLEKEK